jgi:hypothetical protein
LKFLWILLLGSPQEWGVGTSRRPRNSAGSGLGGLGIHKQEIPFYTGSFPKARVLTNKIYVELTMK